MGTSENIFLPRAAALNAERPAHSARSSPRSDRGAFAKDYFERYPKDQYRTEIESWRHPLSANIEFTVKQRRELP
jgi:hypothetical protein